MSKNNTWVKVKYINRKTNVSGEYTFFSWKSFREWAERVSVVNRFDSDGELQLVSVRGLI